MTNFDEILNLKKNEKLQPEKVKLLPSMPSVNHSNSLDNTKGLIGTIRSLHIDENRMRYLVFIMVVAISCFLVGQAGYNLTDDPIFRWISVIIFVIVDLIGQFCLSLGKGYRKYKRKTQLIFFVIFGIYVLLFSIPVSVGFFNSEVSKSSNIFKQAVNNKAEISTRLKQIAENLIVDYALLLTESKTGYGDRAVSVQLNINALTSEQSLLYNQLHSTNITEIFNKQSYFDTLSSAILIPADLIKFLMFYTSMAMIVFAMVITCPAFMPSKAMK